MRLFDRMVVAGVGLIGGSLGLAARQRSLVGEVVGYGRGEENLATALARGAVDRYSRCAAEAARGADLLVVAVPVRSTRAVVAQLLPHAAAAVVVIDAGSVKGPVVEALEALVSPPAAFVGCHPIAGTELSGAANAAADLFEGQLCVLTPTARTDARALERVRSLWEGVGMRLESMAADDHDRLLALVSHLPHAVAYALIAAIEGERVGGRDPLAYSGGGLRDTTRIAASPAEMWRDIFLDNRSEALRAIDRFAAALARLRDGVERGDAGALDGDLGRARAARSRLKERRS
ncbi:MAG: prephenate dehydrogenase/arogenate dehydrogenase family protein [Deltaproteobacteria bacterium]|nr:prephenate dehydrogenase/arogenate dehydrogenase family protein [Deltaproteobacteria bacterium]